MGEASGLARVIGSTACSGSPHVPRDGPAAAAAAGEGSGGMSGSFRGLCSACQSHSSTTAQQKERSSITPSQIIVLCLVLQSLLRNRFSTASATHVFPFNQISQGSKSKGSRHITVAYTSAFASLGRSRQCRKAINSDEILSF